MPIVDVTLNHRVYPIACDQGQEDRLRHVARFLQHRVKELRNQAPGATDAHLLVMASLMLADELTDAKARAQAAAAGHAEGQGGTGDVSPGENAEGPESEAMASMVSDLAERIETIAQRLEQA
jgi:cell division protein ZapA